MSYRQPKRKLSYGRNKEKLKGARIATNGLWKKLNTGEELLSGKRVGIEAEWRKTEATPIVISLERGDFKVGVACKEFENLEITKSKITIGRGKNCIIVTHPESSDEDWREEWR